MNPPDHTTSLDADSTVRGLESPPMRQGVEPRRTSGIVASLRASPELVRNRSFVIEQAVEEFKQLKGAQSFSPDEYCKQFAEFGTALQSSIFRQLEVELCASRFSWLRAGLTEDPWPKAGERWGSFQILEELGRGAMGRVYLCTQPELGGRQVVVKAADSAVLEADILGRLRHPNIVPLHSMERIEGSRRTLLCMPFLGRSTWADFLDLARDKPGNVSLRAAGMLWAQATDEHDIQSTSAAAPAYRSVHESVSYLGSRMAAALAYAHSRGIVHGDIKPSNILLTRSGAPLLMDFNLSGTTLSPLSARGGTLAYMPPEQIQALLLQEGGSPRYDGRSDLFSLGVVLYQSLVARHPFVPDDRGSDLVELAERILQSQRAGCVPLRSIDKSISRSLAAVVEQSLSFHKEDRCPSAVEFQAKLERELRPTSRIKRQVSRRPRLTVSALCLTGLVTLGIAMFLMLRPPAHVRFLAHARDNISENNLAAAEEDLDSALRLKPDFADALFELGRVSLARKDYSRAREWFLKLDKAETGPRGAAYLAYSFSVGGNPTLAIPWYERAISLGSQSAAVYNNLAFAYEIGRSRYDRNELLDRSAASLRRAMELAPGSHTVWLNLICLAVRQHELQETRISDEAIQLSRKLGKLHPTCGFVQLSTARALALAANDRPELSNEAVRSLELAANVGFAPSRDILESAPEWNALRANGDFARLVKTVTDKQQPRVGKQLSRLLNP